MSRARHLSPAEAKALGDACEALVLDRVGQEIDEDEPRWHNRAELVEAAGMLAPGDAEAWSVELRERPILFSGPMVAAILRRENPKTQTRRIVKPQPSHPSHYLQPMWGTSPDGVAFGEAGLWREVGPDYPDDARGDRRCPYGVPGDRLWLKETWGAAGDNPEVGAIFYKEDSDLAGPERPRSVPRWRSARFMPRRLSRITLEIVSVRGERLQEITEEDAKAEGIEGTDMFRQGFSVLWDHINGKRAPWSSNQWVWRIEFRRVEEARHG